MRNNELRRRGPAVCGRGCPQGHRATGRQRPQPEAVVQSEASISLALRIVDDASEELRRSLSVRQQRGLTPKQLPDVSLTEAERRSPVGRSPLDRADAIEPDTLPHDLARTLRSLRFRARTWAQEAAKAL
jgi:hypothetical protein